MTLDDITAALRCSLDIDSKPCDCCSTCAGDKFCMELYSLIEKYKD